MENTILLGSKSAHLIKQLKNRGFENIQTVRVPNHIIATKGYETWCFEIVAEDFLSPHDDVEITPEEIEWERIVSASDQYRWVLIHLKQSEEAQVVLLPEAA